MSFRARSISAGKQRLGSRELYVNELFLTLVRRPLQGRGGLLDRLQGWSATPALLTGRRHLAAEKRALDAAGEALIAALGAYSPRLLTVYPDGDDLRSEPLEFLSWLYNGEMRPVVLPHGDLGEHLPFRRISFGQDAFELAPAGHLPRKFGAIISVKDYPAQTLPGMFDELYRMPFEMTVSQSFAFVERGEALGRMNLALRRMRSTEDEALSLRAELTQAKDDVAAGRAGFGEHHTTIAIHADEPRSARRPGRRSDRRARRSGDRRGARGYCAGTRVLGAVSRQLQIYRAQGRWSRPATSRGWPACTTSRSGSARGNHWGDAVTLFETTAAGPYFFNFHHGDLGNFTVIGPSGSGKTVVLNFLLAQARKFAPRIVFFDKDRGAELFIRAIGGQYDRLRPGAASGLNPLQLDDTPANRQFLIEWLTMLAGGADSDETETIKDAVDGQFRPGRAATAGCAIWSSCSAATSARAAAISMRGCGHGGARASAPGCSTTPKT